TQCADDLRFAHVNPSVVRVRAAFPPEQRARRGRAAASRVFALVFHIVTGFSPGLTGRGGDEGPIRCAPAAAARSPGMRRGAPIRRAASPPPVRPYGPGVGS